jgi:hypothetical protein
MRRDREGVRSVGAARPKEAVDVTFANQAEARFPNSGGCVGQALEPADPL